MRKRITNCDSLSQKGTPQVPAHNSKDRTVSSHVEGCTCHSKENFFDFEDLLSSVQRRSPR